MKVSIKLADGELVDVHVHSVIIPSKQTSDTRMYAAHSRPIYVHTHMYRV